MPSCRRGPGSPWHYAALALMGLVSAPLGAQPAHPASGTGGIFTCIDDQGHRLTSDRPIAECSGREQRVLNRDGSLRSVLPPTLTADERAEKEARDRRMAEARSAQADALRRDRNLMQRYPNEAAHQKAREAALDNVRASMVASEQRLRELAAERKPLSNEAEFYKGRAMPAALKGQLDANDAAVEAQRSAMLGQQAELGRVNRLYDAELERLKKLWAGAPPGSLGPVSPDAKAAPANVKTPR